MPKGEEILVVEDDTFIGLDIADLLEGAGYRVSGPHGTAAGALRALSAGSLDLAILDVQLADGETSEVVAEQLESAGTPILFVSGYDWPHGLARFPRAPRIAKPWDPNDLLNHVTRALSRPGNARVAAPRSRLGLARCIMAGATARGPD